VHTTARFMPGHRLVRGAAWVLGLWPAGRATTGAVLAQGRTCRDDGPACRPLSRQCRAEAGALWAGHTLRTPPGLTPAPLPQGAPRWDPRASGRVRQAFPRSLHPPLATATSLGLETGGWPLRSTPIASRCGLPKQHGAGPLTDAKRMALRLPA